MGKPAATLGCKLEAERSTAVGQDEPAGLSSDVHPVHPNGGWLGSMEDQSESLAGELRIALPADGSPHLDLVVHSLDLERRPVAGSVHGGEREPVVLLKHRGVASKIGRAHV